MTESVPRLAVPGLAVSGLAVPRRVSVIVPTRDRPQFLRQALESIRRLEGDDLAFEIIVGDNGSMPETKSVAVEFEAIYLRADVRGAAAARNVCLRAATCDYIAFLDDDDAWLAGNIRPQLQVLEADLSMDAIIGQSITADVTLNPISAPWPDPHPGEGDALTRAMLSGFFPQIGSFVARTSVRNDIGYFDEKLIGGQDLDWMLRLARRRKLGHVSMPGVLVRSRADHSYDRLQRLRVGFDRRVFLRHAASEWRIWQSPRALLQAYTGTLMHFYRYFESAAVAHAEKGNQAQAMSAILSAFYVFPVRAASHAIRDRPLRNALWELARSQTHRMRGGRR